MQSKMTAAFESTLEQFRRVAQALHPHEPSLRQLLERAFNDDLEQAADAIRRIERDFDRELAALVWSFFWIRQGDFLQARNELERMALPGKARSIWDGMTLLLLGEVCLELGEAKRGAALIRRAQQILEPAIKPDPKAP